MQVASFNFFLNVPSPTPSCFSIFLNDRPQFLSDICKKIGVKPFGWHSFRHRKASIMAQNNIPLVEIMNYLGHDNIEVTQGYLRLLGYTKY
jgi:integrase